MIKLTAAIIALAATASVAQAAPIAIQVGDLDLGTTKGMVTYNHRVDTAARQFCNNGLGPIVRNVACEKAVKAEAGDKLAAIKQPRTYAQR